MNLWQRKLLAYLHDPPSKPFNIVEHRAMAESLIRNAGFEPADVAWFFDKVCDHTAAAADRVICPKSSQLRAEWNESAAFKHPLGGGELHFEQPIRHAEAEAQVAKLQPQNCGWEKLGERQDWAKFFVHWRLWRQRCAEKHPSLAHLPADTRIPDHTIWTHCSIVSALQSCVKIEREHQAVEMRDFQPAFLLLQIGPVQEFIAQARTTRDLWSGSYLLSWLIAHGIKAITDEVGPDCVLFPALRGQPLFDFLHKESLYDKMTMWDELRHSQEQILTPNLPNRFLAVVPAWQAQQLAVAAENAMARELQRIGDACAAWLKVEDTARPRWDQQIAQFLTVHWQTWQWEPDVASAIAGHAELKQAHEAAIAGIPKQDLDPRNYKHRSWREGDTWVTEILTADGQPIVRVRKRANQPEERKIVAQNGQPFIDNPGFAWAAHYRRVDELLAARRNTRDFDAWATDDANRTGAVKDQLSGKEEVIGSENWQKELHKLPKHRFGKEEKLGALNLIKRVWDIAYLQPKGLKRTPRFDSLPAIAAASFAIEIVDKMTENSDAWPLLLDFQKAATGAATDFGAEISDAKSESDWIRQSDASIFHVVEWDRTIRDTKDDAAARARLSSARDALKKLLGKDGLNQSPSRYVAVIALDGDSMGKWISGALSPHWRGQLAAEAVTYFEGQPLLKTLLDTRRQVSPSYHVQLSEALANFALYLAGPIVEYYDGQLIYAGGDDVLAMLPAERALPCARALRMAFRGDPNLPSVFPGAMAGGCQPGFLAIDGEWEGWKRWEKKFLKRGFHLLVPGQNADLSAGIAIGHMHSPLQNLVEAAREAEKRAKRAPDKGGYGKSAFAVSLFKRSGETIQWGAKWDSHAIELAQRFEDNFCEGKRLSGRFPYALAELLRKYDPLTIQTTPQFDAPAVIRKDLEHVVGQQGKNVPDSFVATATNYLEDCRGHRLDDFLGPFLTVTFVTRGGEA